MSLKLEAMSPCAYLASERRALGLGFEMNFG